MTLCPIAIVASCKQCPVFKVCPAKGLIGDHVPPAQPGAKGTSGERPPTRK